MSFAYPLYLVGVAAAALPILIHLLVKQRRRAIPFSTLRFLRLAQLQRQGRRRLSQWLLLLLRVLVCLLLALALARPVLTHVRGGFLARLTRVAAVLIVDNSYSMGSVRDDTSDFNRAKDLARRMIEDLPERSRVAVLNASEPPQNLELVTPAAALNTLQSAALYDGPVDLMQRIEDARRLLRHVNATTREIVVFTDLQKLSFPPSTVNPQPSTLNPQLVLVDMRGNTPAENLAIVSGKISEGKTLAPSAWRVSVTVRNTGSTARSATAVLRIDGSQRAQRPLPAISPGKTTEVTFAVPPLPEGLRAGTVELSADPVAADNRYYFVLPVRERWRALLVDGASTAPQGAAFYLRAALDSLRTPAGKPLMEVTTTTGVGLSAAALSGKGAVVFTYAPLLDAAQREQLQGFITGGGGALIFLDERTPVQRFNSDWAQKGLAPTSVISRVAVRDSESVYLSTLDFAHPALSLFDNPQSADLTRAKFRAYFRLSDALAPNAKVLARFNNGDPALVENTLGFGRVLLFASGAHARSSELPLTKSFVAFIHQMLSYLAAPRRHRALAVGATLNAPGAQLLRPDGKKEGIQDSVTLTRAGLYKISHPPSPISLVPVNPDTAESDLTRLTAAELTQRLGGDARRVDASRSTTPLELSTHAVDLWQPLMWLVLGLALLEVVLATGRR